MGPADTTGHDDATEPADDRADGPQVRTLLLTDLCDSTGLVERLGDTPAKELFRAHDRLVLELQQRWRGRLIDRSDGLLLLFERPIDGLGFALDYNRGLRELGKARKIQLLARAGLHVGEVLTWRNSDASVQLGAKPLEVEGLAKPMAGRLMTMARPGQILLSSSAEPMARRAVSELDERGKDLVWKHWGRWRFKGVPQPQEIYEVGEPGIAPLRRPEQNHAKAWRDIPLWRRPAALAAELLLVAGLLGGAWFMTRPQPAIAFNERDWVVVGDLRNLTGDKVLDDSLDQAFRISLAQSRFINVISDLRVRETLQHMQRKPDVPVDRVLGSEIALRDGARAFLLPTVAEVGGHLRVSAEVIDPHTQTTVYAVSADGNGVESALASIDDVTSQLRNKLGEALESVQKTSVSLPNVSTPSLDALKAFAVARNVVATTRDRDTALGLYRQALQLDPQFALAHADMAQFHAALGAVQAAQDEWRKALAIPNRLSPQEKQRIELLLQQYAGTGSYFRKAREYLTLYPDDYGVIARLSTNQWHQLNDFGQAETLMRRTLTPSAAQQGGRYYSIGIYLLGQEQYADAQSAFRKSRALGFTGSSTYFARLYDVRQQPGESDRIYAQGHGGKPWKGDDGVTTWIDRGLWDRAGETARSWLKREQNTGDALEALRAQAALASVAVLDHQSDARRELRALLATARSKAKIVDASYPATSTEVQLLVGLLAGFRDDATLLTDALAGVDAKGPVRDFPTLSQLQQVVLAEQERLAGRPQAAAKRLRPLARQDTALVAVHWALQRAEQAAANADAATVQSRWLATHRGRALTESTTTEVLRFFNAAVSARALESQPNARARLDNPTVDSLQ